MKLFSTRAEARASSTSVAEALERRQRTAEKTTVLLEPQRLSDDAVEGLIVEDVTENACSASRAKYSDRSYYYAHGATDAPGRAEVDILGSVVVSLPIPLVGRGESCGLPVDARRRTCGPPSTRAEELW